MGWEEILIQSGALGILGYVIHFGTTKLDETISSAMKTNSEVIENNTIAITQVKDIISKCNRK